MSTGRKPSKRPAIVKNKKAAAERRADAGKHRRANNDEQPTQRLKDIPIDELRFDQRNPRLPEMMRNSTQDELLREIANEYQAIEVGRSIAAHGYFPSEPLIVVVENGENVVVEGNRRLAALRLLRNPEKAEALELDDAEDWQNIDSAMPVPNEVPCVVAASREIVAPIIGYRHISGIEPWEAWARARFIAAFVENDQKDFEEVASLVGEGEATVRAHYRNFRLAKQMEDSFGIDAGEVRLRFGVLTRAMQDQRIRAFLGAPDAREVEADADPLPKNRKARAREFVKWVFGDGGHPPLFTDSRKLVELGVVLGSEEATDELRRTNDLEASFALAGGVELRLLNRLDRAAGYLESARTDIGDYVESDNVVERLDRLDELLEVLREGGDA